MVFDARELKEAVGAKVVGVEELEPSLKSISTDTRLLEKSACFFALVGKKFDAHDFLGEALEKGVKHFVVSDEAKIKRSWRDQAQFMVVEDTLSAYGAYARYHRMKFKVPVVAVTGSSGKTTVKELLSHLLSSQMKVLKNRGTENNLVGVPKTLLQLNETHAVAVLELGTNAPGEIERLSYLCRPNIGIITQIGHSHLEGLKSLDGVLSEKSKIMAHLERGGILILNGEDPRLASLQSGVHRVMKAGLSAGNDLFARQVKTSSEGSSIRASDDQEYETSLLGRHNAVNVLLAVLAAKVLGLEGASIRKALPTFKAVPGRLTLKSAGDFLFLDDTYNANPTSLKAALETLFSLRDISRRIVVCGDMLELGDQAESLHREAGRDIAVRHTDGLIAAGHLAAFMGQEAVAAGMAEKDVHFARDSAEAGKILQKIVHAGDAVLVKGSRGMQMEKVFECFTNCSIR